MSIILKQILLQNMWGNRKVFSVGKFVVHRCDPQKCGEFLCIVPQSFGLKYLEKWISEAQIMGELCM
jgi:hypothetical protein